MTKARETRERHTDKYHNSMLSLGFEPPNHGVAAIVMCRERPFMNGRRGLYPQLGARQPGR